MPAVGGVCSLGGLAPGSFYVPYAKSKNWGAGNLLAGWRIFKLDHRAMAVGSDYDSRPQSVLQRAPQRYPLGLLLWGALGPPSHGLR
jgi:hypothetical protein